MSGKKGLDGGDRAKSKSKQKSRIVEVEVEVEVRTELACVSGLRLDNDVAFRVIFYGRAAFLYDSAVACRSVKCGYTGSSSSETLGQST